jgi:hypothetical protein
MPEVGGGTGVAIPGAELVAGVVKDTLGAFKARFGAKSDAPAGVAAKCRACGAPMNGLKGQPLTCEYCGSVQEL